MKRTVLLSPHFFPDGYGISPVATVETWEKELGQVVFVGESLVRLRASTGFFTVPSPETGVLAKKCVLPGETLEPGEPVAILGGVSAPLPVAESPVFVPSPETGADIYKLSQTEQAVAQHHQRVWRTTPHGYVVTVTDVSEPLRFIAKINRGETVNGDQETLTLLPFVLAEVARSLTVFPELNAQRHTVDIVLRNRLINIGVEARSKHGMNVTPVLHDTGNRSVLTLAREWKRFQDKLLADSLTDSDISGATFTVSWSPDVLYRTPLLHRPLAGHLNFGKVINGQVYLCLTYDLAIVPSDQAERFLSDVANSLSSGRFLFSG